MHVKNQIANRVREWLNSEWGRLKLSSYDNQKEPFDDKTMPLLLPKGMIICAHSTCHFMSWDSSQHNPPFFYFKAPFQVDNVTDCGVFVCRYAYSLYTIRHQKFTFAHINNKCKDLITTNPAFTFNMSDIARIREEMKTLIDRLSREYFIFKREEREKERENRGLISSF